MASIKTTALATGTPDPVVDWLGFVDVSDTTMAASGTNKKVLSDNLRFSVANGATGTTPRTAKDKLADLVSVKDFGAVGDGVTNDAAALQAAVTAAEGDGRALCIPPGVVVRCNTPVTGGTGPLTIYGGGKILVPPDAGGFMDYTPAMGTARAVTTQSIVASPYAGQLCTLLALASGGSDFVPGRIAYHHSLQPYAYDATVDKGEIVTVLAVAGNNVYIQGLLAEDYLPGSFTNTLRTMSDYRLCVDDIQFEGQQTLNDSAQALRATLAVTGCVSPYVNARFKSLAGRGFVAAGCYDGDFIIRAKDLKDDATNSYYGYAATALNATRQCRFDVRAHRVRHAFTTNVYSRSGFLLWDSGAARENVITGEAMNTTSAAWDTHGGAYDNIFQNIKAFWTHQNDDDASGSGRQWALQDRACGTMVDGLIAIGGMQGITLQGQGNQHRRDNITRIKNVHCSNRSGDNGRVALDLQATTTNGSESSFRFEAHIDSAEFVNFASFDLANLSPILHLGRRGGVSLTNQLQIRPGTGNTIHLHDVTREHLAGNSDEAWRLANTNVVYAHKYTVLGDVALNTPFTTSTSGTSTLYVGQINAPLTDWRRVSLAGSHVVTQAKLRLEELSDSLPLNTWTKHTSRITRTASTPTAGTYPGTPGDFGMASTAGNPWLGTSTNNTQAVEGVQIEYAINRAYIAGGPVRVRVRAKVGTTRTVKQTVDVTAQVIADGTVGSDICATAEQTVTTSYANYYFTITPTTLLPGIAVKLAVVAYNDDTGGSSGSAMAVAEVAVEYMA